MGCLYFDAIFILRWFLDSMCNIKFSPEEGYQSLNWHTVCLELSFFCHTENVMHSMSVVANRGLSTLCLETLNQKLVVGLSKMTRNSKVILQKGGLYLFKHIYLLAFSQILKGPYRTEILMTFFHS